MILEHVNFYIQNSNSSVSVKPPILSCQVDLPGIRKKASLSLSGDVVKTGWH